MRSLHQKGNYRSLAGTVSGIDFWSNDYLGLARSQVVPELVEWVQGAVPTTTSSQQEYSSIGLSVEQSPSPGSRSISGDHAAYHHLEQRIATYHGHEAALVFNSGYTANLGLLASLLRRTDTIIYDELMHASCRDGIRLGQARSLRFTHNDLEDIRNQLAKARTDGQTFVLTEGRFSMDGDLAPLPALAALCQETGAHLIVDEAHSGGIDGPNGAGLIAHYGLQDQVFATVVTYGKAFGTHGAAVLGSNTLRKYLINTCRPFIYTTAPPPTQWNAIARAYDQLETQHPAQITSLQQNIAYFRAALQAKGIADTGP